MTATRLGFAVRGLMSSVRRAARPWLVIPLVLAIILPIALVIAGILLEDLPMTHTVMKPARIEFVDSATVAGYYVIEVYSELQPAHRDGDSWWLTGSDMRLSDTTDVKVIGRPRARSQVRTAATPGHRAAAGGD